MDLKGVVYKFIAKDIANMVNDSGNRDGGVFLDYLQEEIEEKTGEYASKKLIVRVLSVVLREMGWRGTLRPPHEDFDED